MNILTFDIEDWFHTHENRQRYSGYIWDKLPSKVIGNTNRILEMLEKRELKATFFILGWVAQKHPELIREIHSKGHEIGAHSFWHHNPHRITLSDFENDLKRCLSVIQDITGEKVRAYRAPGFNLGLKDQKAFDILAAQGIEVDSSIQLRLPPGKIPPLIPTSSKPVVEFPLITSVWGIPYSGGGYFRTLPFPLVKQLFRKQEYHLLYFHPRDFDPDYPDTNLFSFLRNQMNQWNTSRCMGRLEEILTQYQTGTLLEAARSCLIESSSHEP